MDSFRVEATRGSAVESVHRVSAAVVDADGRLLAACGDPHLVTFWRSAAKPFQTLPLIEDGVVERFGLTDEELAIATASHSSEDFHLAAVDRFLAKIGLGEEHLACGPHLPLSAEVARQATRAGVVMTPRWSNCSGKHTGLLALAQHHDWPLVGYERAGHPVQDRILTVVEAWTGMSRHDLVLAVDGCTTVCFGLPLNRMALGYARFGAATDPAPRRLWRAITGRPDLIAGTGRLCTLLMEIWPGEIFAKVGADGIYCAAVPSRRWGVALKVEDGDFRSSGIALVGVLRRLLARDGRLGEVEARLAELTEFADPPLRSTRGTVVGQLRAAGDLEFFGF